VDAHYGASVTLSYFKDVHGRNGVDGRGATVKSRVHLSKGYDNAYCECRLGWGGWGRAVLLLYLGCSSSGRAIASRLTFSTERSTLLAPKTQHIPTNKQTQNRV